MNEVETIVKTINEKLESVEEIQQILVNKMTAIENRKTEIAEISIPDYAGQFQQIRTILKGVMHNRFSEKLDVVVQKIDHIPSAIPVSHHHHFDLRSKGFIIGGMILLLFTAISIGVSFSLYSQNSLLEGNSWKFRMIRQDYPKVASWADSVYYKDPETMIELTKEREAAQEAFIRAEADARLKQLEAEKAKKEMDRIKNKRKSHK